MEYPGWWIEQGWYSEHRAYYENLSRTERERIGRKRERDEEKARKARQRFLIRRAKKKPPARKTDIRHGRHGGNFCIRGHERTPENTYIRKSGSRQCLACKHLEKKRNNPKRWARDKAKVKAQKQAELAARRALLTRPPMRGVSE